MHICIHYLLLPKATPDKDKAFATDTQSNSSDPGDNGKGPFTTSHKYLNSGLLPDDLSSKATPTDYSNSKATPTHYFINKESIPIPKM